MINMVKLPTKNKRMFLRVARGHFATSHSHINYYIDATMQKNRLSEAAEAARELVHMYKSTTIVDTVLCLDGTQVIGTCLANELTKDGFRNMNAHQTIYIITPEYTSGSQIILRDNIAPMVGHRGGAVLRRPGGGAVGHLCHHPRVHGLSGQFHLRPQQPARLSEL